MKDYGGFAEEPFYDLDGDGELDLFEQANMHTEQDFEMIEMVDDPLVSNTAKKDSHPTGKQKMGCGTRLTLFFVCVLFYWLAGELDIGFFWIIAFIIIVILAVN